MTPEFGDIAIVTTRSGHRFVAVWTDGSPIDYYWLPLLREDKAAWRQLADPDESYEIIGKTI